MKAHWQFYLLPQLLFSVFLLIASQLPFLYMSFFKDLRLGRTGNLFTWANYQVLFQDEFYLKAAVTTIELSAVVAVLTLIMGFPVAYILARMRSRWSLILLAAVVTTSFITVVVKVLGLMIIFSANGFLNRTLMTAGLIDHPISIIGTMTGIVIGLLHFTLGLAVIMFYGVVRTIPRSLEEAACIHGANRLAVFRRIIVPLALPSAVSVSLIAFNLCMGAFTSTALLGGGKIFTLPILIQQTVILQTRYSLGAALSTVLLVATLLMNMLSILAVSKSTVTRGRTS